MLREWAQLQKLDDVAYRRRLSIFKFQRGSFVDK